MAGQITHWLKLGRAIERSGVYDHARVTAALEGRLDTTQLSDAEEALYAERQALGRDVGLDAGGNLIHAGDDAVS